MSDGWANGSTRKWRKTRSLVLQRDQHRCQLRLEGCTTRATCVHHTIGKINGDDPKNLVASCQHCNLAIGDPNRTQADPPIKTRTQW